MTGCPSRTDLEHLLEGTLDAACEESVDVHLRSCSSCRDVLEDLTKPLRQRTPTPEDDLSEFHHGGAANGSQERKEPNSPIPFSLVDLGKLTPSPFRALDPSSFKPPKPNVPGYEILEELGFGGGATVYRARHLGLRRLVALKVLDRRSARPTDLVRFRREAESAARLRHPNIVPIFDFGEQGDVPYLAMELVEGGTLAARLAGNPLPPRQAARLVEPLARAVEEIHAQGLVHRDLKPANVLLAPADLTTGVPLPGIWTDEYYCPKVTDFGLAKGLHSEGLTQPHDFLGTPSHMAPEQARGRWELVGPRSDVYALGAILYECLTGRPPFKTASPAETMLQVAFTEPLPPSRFRTDVPRDLEAVCLKCLEKEPTRRYATARDLADDLGRFLADQHTQARPIGRISQAWRWCRRNPLVAGLLAALILTLTLGIVVTSLLFVAATRQAHQAAQQAEAAARESRRFGDRAYAADVRLAAVACADGDATLARDLLEAHRPDRGDGIDRRGFEWYYWHGQLRRSEILCEPGGGRCFALAVRGPQSEVVLGSEDGTIRIWDTQKRSIRHRWQAHKASCFGLASHPSGDVLASVDRGGNVALWDLGENKQIPTVNPPTLVGNKIAFLPSGRLAGLGTGGRVLVWDPRTGAQQTFPVPNSRPVNSLACSRAGELLAIGVGSHATVWDVTSNRQVFATSEGSTHVVAFSHDGKHLVGSELGLLRMWEIATGKVVFGRATPPNPVNELHLSPDGKLLAVCALGRLQGVLDVSRQGQPILCPGHKNPVVGLGFCSRGHLYSASRDGELRVWGPDFKPSEISWGLSTNPLGGCYCADGQSLATHHSDGQVRLWNSQSGELRTSLTISPHGIGSVDCSRDGTLAVGCKDGSIALVPPQQAPVIERLRGHQEWVSRVAFHPNGKLLASGSFDQTVRLWDLAAHECVAVLRDHAGHINGLAWSPDGRELASLALDKTVRVWDLTTRAEVRRFSLASGFNAGLTFSPDGLTLAAGGSDGAVWVWDRETGLLLQCLRGHTAPVGGLCFSPDGRALAASAWDGQVRLWAAATGQELLHVRGDRINSYDLCFSPKGDQLVSISPNGMRAWVARRNLEE